ncbi:hypothetical protein SK128_028335, partial [Halocaridina rubra]
DMVSKRHPALRLFPESNSNLQEGTEKQRVRLNEMVPFSDLDLKERGSGQQRYLT